MLRLFLVDAETRVGFWAVIFHRPTLLGGFQSRTEKDQGLLHNITTKTAILSLDNSTDGTEATTTAFASEEDFPFSPHYTYTLKLPSALTVIL